MSYDEVIALCYENPFFAFILGFVFCQIADIFFAVSSFYVERGLSSRDFRLGRMVPLSWLQDDDIRYYVKRQIIEIDKQIEEKVK